MKHLNIRISAAVLSVTLLAASTSMAQGYQRIKGEVVSVQQQTANQGADQFVTVRTRSGELRQFRLGDEGRCTNCVQVGDRIQARVASGRGDRPGMVQSMKVRRNREMYGYAQQSGQLVQTRQRLRDGSGDGRQAQQRGRNGGNRGGGGDCPANGSGGGGGRGAGGGGR